MNRAKAGTITVALTFIAVGAALLAHQFGLWQWDMLRYVGPFVLIALGLEIIVMRSLHAGQGLRYSALSFVVAVLAIAVSVGYSGFTVFVPGFSGPVDAMPVAGELAVAPGVKRVEVDIPIGRINVTGSSGNSVRYDGRLLVPGGASAHADEELARHWTAEQQGDTLVLRQIWAPHWRSNWGWGWPSGRAHLNVEVPAGLEVSIRTRNSTVEAGRIDAERLTLRTSNARIIATDVNGPLSATTSNSNVTVHNIDGAADVKTSNASVSVQDVRGALDVTTSNGSISATSAVLGDWRLRTSNSSITINVPTDTDAYVQASTSNSKVGGSVRWDTKNQRETTGSTTLGAGTHRVTLDTSNSSIRVNMDH